LAGLLLGLFWVAQYVPLAPHHLRYAPSALRLKVVDSALVLRPVHLALPTLLLALLAALLLAVPVLAWFHLSK
jgi:hypothetical protein